MTAEHPDPSVLWKHRRRMAYGGLIFSAACIITGLGLGIGLPMHAVSTIIPLCTTGFWGGLLPMAAYMGNTLAEEIAKVRSAGR